jgi:hypothetical protein
MAPSCCYCEETAAPRLLNAVRFLRSGDLLSACAGGKMRLKKNFQSIENQRGAIRSVFSILAAKSQSNNQTQETDGRHHSEDCRDAKLTFQDRQNKDTESRAYFSDTSSETAGGGP